MSGRFVTFEGIDGAGKSTHVDWYVERLKARGIDAIRSREPGGTPLAERLRELLLTQPMSMDTELMLMFAARRDHLERLIRPALAAGKWVVCDRFTDSTWAYQGGGRRGPAERIAWLEAWVHGDLQPDRTYLFDLPAGMAAQRRAAARDADRFEREDEAFFERVREAYRGRAGQAPERFRLIDGRLPIEDIRKILEEDIASIGN
ncbi:dTMP kinase [Burkholderiaceae bacterium FT117]|uniref:dTMP kinase n=1 Tax=Zeimonas sediminis TaxID=2944268 RepID=UPI0023431AB2|nr:dTMP kinase [Zeimonas sediminis]MCM5569248.1 dTMP kinase [Zeimonas sediminis]